MIRNLLLVVLLPLFSTAQAQTVFRVTNVQITEKDQVRTGTGATAMVKGSEGDDRIVIFDQDGLEVKTQVRLRTHDSNRSSVKESAVYATFELNLKVDGKNDRRELRKVFYADQERKTHIKEKFTIKRGIDVRVITVEFDGSLE